MAAIDLLCTMLSPSPRSTGVEIGGIATAREAEMLEASNAALLTPALHTHLQRDGGPAWSADHRALIKAFFEMNRQRNALLAEQLVECARTMNANGVRPLVLKGAATLLTEDDDARARRVVRDIDLQIPENRAFEIERLLNDLGYSRLRGYADNPHAHAIADLTRPGDGAAIDLHRELLSYAGHRGGRGHLAGLLPVDRVRASAEVVTFRGAEFLVPAPRDWMLHLILQDQIQDRDHFAGRLKLRRLLDLAEAMAAHPDIDGGDMVQALRPYGLAGATASHFYAAHALFGAPLSPSIRHSFRARLHQARRRFVALHPWSAPGSVLIGAMAYEFARCRFPPDVPAWRLLRWRAERLVQVLRRRRFGVVTQLQDVAVRL